MWRRRLARRRPDGTLTPRAQRAWTRLAARGKGLVLREAWLRDPHEDTWAVVRQWVTVSHVLTAATDVARDVENRCRIGKFCVEHDMVPRNAVERVVFYALTGQAELCRAADPDGSLLASGYRAASEPTREALRDSMVGAGELGLVRAIVDRPDRVLDDAEADYLAGQLAAAAEWEQLWRKLPMMKFGAAARAAKLFQDWHPADDPGRAYLASLAGADPESLTTRSTVTRIKPLIGTSLTRVDPCFSFAPGGLELAVTEEDTRVLALPGGKTIDGYAGWLVLRPVLAVGGGAVVCRSEKDTLARPGPGRRREKLLQDAGAAVFALTPDGFVVGHRDRLYFGGRTGPWTRTCEAPGRLLAADPGSGRLLFQRADTELLLTDPDLGMLGRGRAGHPVDAEFCGPDRTLVQEPGGSGDFRSLGLWRLDGARLVETATTDISAAATTKAVPAHDLVLLGQRETSSWLDADTLEQAPAPAGVMHLDGGHMTFSPDGSLVAAQTEDFKGFEVRDLWLGDVVELAGRSLSQGRLADLRTVAVPSGRQVDPSTRATVAALRAGLEYRLGGEIALGSGTPGARPDDIALGGG